MDDPAGFRIEQDFEGTRYILPPRKVPRAGGFVLLGMGLFVTIFMLFWMAGPIIGGLNARGGFKWVSVVFGLLGLPGLLAGLGMFSLGFAVLTGRSRSEIYVGRTHVEALERFGPFRWRRRRKLGPVRRIVAGGTVALRNRSGGAVPPFAQNLSMVRVEFESAKPITLAAFYPAALVEALGVRLSEALGQALERAAPSVEHAAPPPVVLEEDAAADETMEQPPGSDVTVRDYDKGFALHIPPAGAWKGSKGLFGFSLFWNAFISIFLVVIVVAAAKGADGPGWLGLLFLVPFYAVGIGTLLGALNMGRRETLLAVTGDKLGVRTTGLFGTKEQVLPIGDIAAIGLGPSGMEVNNRPVFELQIRRRDGGKIGLLSQRRDPEIAWIAAVLRRRTGVPRHG